MSPRRRTEFEGLLATFGLTVMFKLELGLFEPKPLYFGNVPTSHAILDTVWGGLRLLNWRAGSLQIETGSSLTPPTLQVWLEAGS